MNKPRNKLTLSDVADEFRAAGCELQSGEYISNKSPLTFLCKCGRVGLKGLVHFRRKPMCKECGYAETGTKNGRISLEDAREIFRSKGCVLLAVKYGNNSTSMPYRCRCGTLHSMSLANFRMGKKCPECSTRTSWNIESVRQYYVNQGCVFLERHFSDVNTVARYRCSCGKESEGSFANFYYRNARCYDCGIRKLSGPNAPQYKAQKTDDEREVQRKYSAYTEWRRAVFNRDGHTCQVCGARGKINAHHLDNYADHKELRTEVSNGITLCVPCHLEFHRIYGQRNLTTRTQFAEFMEKKRGELS